MYGSLETVRKQSPFARPWKPGMNHHAQLVHDGSLETTDCSQDWVTLVRWRWMKLTWWPHPLGRRGVIICMPSPRPHCRQAPGSFTPPPPLFHTAGKCLGGIFPPPPLFPTAGKCPALPPGSLATRGCAPSRRQRTHCCTAARWQPRSLRLTQCEWVGGWGRSPCLYTKLLPGGTYSLATYHASMKPHLSTSYGVCMWANIIPHLTRTVPPNLPPLIHPPLKVRLGTQPGLEAQCQQGGHPRISVLSRSWDVHLTQGQSRDQPHRYHHRMGAMLGEPPAALQQHTQGG